MKNSNIEKLTILITKKIGFTINNKNSAIELLNKYPLECETKKLKKIVFCNGISNSILIF